MTEGLATVPWIATAKTTDQWRRGGSSLQRLLSLMAATAAVPCVQRVASLCGTADGRTIRFTEAEPGEGGACPARFETREHMS